MKDINTAIQNLIQEPVGILGFGAEGRSTLEVLKAAGINNFIIYDSDPSLALPDGVQVYAGADYLSHLPEVETLIRSAGIRGDIQEINNFIESGGRVLSQLEILFEIYPLEKIIGVTGTLGKGTTATLLFEMMERGGHSCLLGGNIGIPMLDLLKEAPDRQHYLILELSSFQLSTVEKSPGTAVVLKTTEEHLDWHINTQEYWEHKANITRFQKNSDLVIYFSDDKGSTYIADLSKGIKKSYGTKGDVKIADNKWILTGESLPLERHKIRGSFNLENIAAAALAALSHGVEAGSLKESALEFTGLKHRLEYLGQTDSFSFYNDSYATRPDATIGAIHSFKGQNLGLILGGSEKNADFKKLSQTIVESSKLSHISFIGETAERLLNSISHLDGQNKIYLSLQPTLFEALDYLLENMDNGIILLSPACASFGLFKDYRERGEAFREMVYSHIYSHT